MAAQNMLNKSNIFAMEEFDQLCELNNNDELDRQSYINDEDRQIYENANLNLNGNKDSIMFFPDQSPKNNTSFTKCYEVTDR